MRNSLPNLAVFGVMLMLAANVISAETAAVPDPTNKTNASASTHIARKASTSADSTDEIQDVLKMLQAGVSAEIVKAYVEQSPRSYHLTPANLIQLKEHSVPDEITTAMLKRAKRGVAGSLDNPGPARARDAGPRRRNAGSVRDGGADPESYDFWWYHYAYPRALAAANQRIWSSNPSGFYPGYGYPYYSALPFAPQGSRRWAPQP